jgi:hypothetical protein
VSAVGVEPGDTEPGSGAEGSYRYGVVFLIVAVVVVLVILTSDNNLSRAVSFALIASALTISVSTARAPSDVRRRRATIAGVVTGLLTLGIATGVIDRKVTLVIATIITLTIPVTLARGLLTLVRRRGVTVQAVTGALAIYLLVGLAFASGVGFAAAVGPEHFFAQGTSGSSSQDVYYSFTVMTTTGFGDLTAAHRVGRALAVIEQLVGQLYLVTVIGVLIGRRVEAGRSV